MAPDTVDQISGTELPVGLLCLGNEPFWSMQYSASEATYSTPSVPNVSLGYSGAMIAGGRPDYPIALAHMAGGETATSIIRPQNCGDGMSDRTYPWQIDLLLGQADYQVGCCYLPMEDG